MKFTLVYKKFNCLSLLISVCLIKSFAKKKKIYILQHLESTTSKQINLLMYCQIFFKEKRSLLYFFLSFRFLLHWKNFSPKELKWIKVKKKERKKERKKEKEKRGRKRNEGQTGNNKEVRSSLNLEVSLPFSFEFFPYFALHLLPLID